MVSGKHKIEVSFVMSQVLLFPIQAIGKKCKNSPLKAENFSKENFSRHIDIFLIYICSGINRSFREKVSIPSNLVFRSGLKSLVYLMRCDDKMYDHSFKMQNPLNFLREYKDGSLRSIFFGKTSCGESWSQKFTGLFEEKFGEIFVSDDDDIHLWSFSDFSDEMPGYLEPCLPDIERIIEEGTIAKSVYCKEILDNFQEEFVYRFLKKFGHVPYSIARKFITQNIWIKENPSEKIKIADGMRLYFSDPNNNYNDDDLDEFAKKLSLLAYERIDGEHVECPKCRWPIIDINKNVKQCSCDICKTNFLWDKLPEKKDGYRLLYPIMKYIGFPGSLEIEAEKIALKFFGRNNVSMYPNFDICDVFIKSGDLVFSIDTKLYSKNNLNTLLNIAKQFHKKSGVEGKKIIVIPDAENKSSERKLDNDILRLRRLDEFPQDIEIVTIRGLEKKFAQIKG